MSKRREKSRKVKKQLRKVEKRRKVESSKAQIENTNEESRAKVENKSRTSQEKSRTNREKATGREPIKKKSRTVENKSRKVEKTRIGAISKPFGLKKHLRGNFVATSRPLGSTKLVEATWLGSRNLQKTKQAREAREDYSNIGLQWFFIN